MRSRQLAFLSPLALLVLAFGCGDDTATETDTDAGPSGSDAGSDVTTTDGGHDGSTSDGATDAGPDAPPIDTTPRKLVSGTASITGVTSDGYVLYRTATGLSVIGTQPNATATQITTASANVYVRGKVAFVFRNIDYTTNLADLDVWTAAGGVKNVGQVLFSEDAIAASDDGSTILYSANVTLTTADLVAAKSDLSAKATLLTMGRSSITTCGARYAFASTHVFSASCDVGSLEGTLRRFDPVMAGSDAGTLLDAGDGGAAWGTTTIATNVQPLFATDAAGTRVLYITTGSQGRIAENGTSTLLDNGVTGGILLPDGSAALYTVGDQLRRTVLPTVNPIPIVTTGYVNRAAFSPDLTRVLYSTTITYVGTEKRDLRLASTTSLNTTADKLAENPEAQLSLSAFTADSDYALWLTNVGTVGAATLNARKVTGGTPYTFPNVVAVAATKGSRVVFTDKRTDALVYPILADIEVVNLSMPVPTAFTLQTKVLDSGSFQVLPGGTAIVYARSGSADDAGAAGDAVYVQALP